MIRKDVSLDFHYSHPKSRKSQNEPQLFCGSFVLCSCFIPQINILVIASIVAEFNAVSLLRDAAADDKILFDEYEVIYEDLREVIAAFIKQRKCLWLQIPSVLV